jgi:hypothetical protein
MTFAADTSGSTETGIKAAVEYIASAMDTETSGGATAANQVLQSQEHKYLAGPTRITVSATATLPSLLTTSSRTLSASAKGVILHVESTGVYWQGGAAATANSQQLCLWDNKHIASYADLAALQLYAASATYVWVTELT